MNGTAEEVRAILAAYLKVKAASWPDLHREMTKRAPHWAVKSQEELREELDSYLAEVSGPDYPVRVFWKLGPKFIFSGCNERFARDAGLASPKDLLGLDDFSPKLPWAAQAAKYRADDKEVFDTGTAKLDILERQTSPSGAVVWVRVGKAPIRTDAGRVIGILGMYDILDEKAAQKLFFERARSGSPKKA
jgi:hypothetical protein